jgi:hypothetical protein
LSSFDVGRVYHGPVLAQTRSTVHLRSYFNRLTQAVLLPVLHYAPVHALGHSVLEGQQLAEVAGAQVPLDDDGLEAAVIVVEDYLLLESE